MQVFFLLGFIFFSHISFAHQIYAIDLGEPGEETLLLLSNGLVHRTSNPTEIEAAQKMITNRKHKAHFFSSLIQDDYEPSAFQSLEEAQALFQTAQYVDKESQCNNRAHVWSYEWFNNFGVNSNKTWLFFTRKYIRKFNFDWWFHVSPSVKLLEGDVSHEIIMDVKYSRTPLNLRAWTNIFMRNDAPCPRVKTYSDYANYPESAWCFTIKTSMYYYRPVDIEANETWGIIRDEWNDSDLKTAYEEAFERYDTRKIP